MLHEYDDKIDFEGERLAVDCYNDIWLDGERIAHFMQDIYGITYFEVYNGPQKSQYEFMVCLTK